MDRLPYNLEVPLDLARRRLKEIPPQIIAAKKGAEWDAGKQQLSVLSLGRNFYISYPSGEISGEEEVDPKLKVLFLHYLTSSGSSVYGRWITFKELPGGALYSSPFYYRAVYPLVRTFAASPESLLIAGRRLGGQQADLGDAAILLHPFPLVPVCLALWQGDEEVPAGATILFDSSITEHLSTEDCAVLAEYLVRRVRSELREKKEA